MSTKHDSVLRKINLLLLLVIILSNGYLIFAPFWPAVKYQFAIKVTKPVHVVTNDRSVLRGIDRTSNRVIIPSLQLEEPYYEGHDSSTTYLGVWHVPYASSPDKGSNTVMVGHSWSYKKPSSAVFYNLSKIKQNGDIVVVYQTKIYHYRVASIQVVQPDQSSVEAPTAKPVLTLYTCTPLLTVSHRLVVESRLVEVL